MSQLKPPDVQNNPRSPANKVIMTQRRASSAPAVASSTRIFCRGCGYFLLGLQSRKCPECGRDFDPANRRTFARRPSRGPLWRWGRRFLAFVILLILAAGAGLGWLWQGWRAEQKAIGQLDDLNARITTAPIGSERLRRLLGERFGYLTDRVKSVSIRQQGADIKGIAFKSLKYLDTLLLFESAEIENAEVVEELAKLPNLKIAGGWGYHPKLEFLAKLHGVKKLTLWGPHVNDAELARISGLNQLSELTIFSNQYVTDAGMKHLRGLASLQSLSLRGNVSDEGLKQLQVLKSLRMLDVHETMVTPAGVAALKKAIPGLVVKQPPKATPTSPESISLAWPVQRISLTPSYSDSKLVGNKA